MMLGRGCHCPRQPEVIHTEGHEHELDARLSECIRLQTFEAGLNQGIADLAGRFPRAVSEQSIADDSLVEDAKPRAPRVPLQPLCQNVGPSMVRIRGRAIPVELRVAEGHDRGSVGGRVDFYPRQEWPGTNRLCHHELREPRRVPRLGRHKLCCSARR